MASERLKRRANAEEAAIADLQHSEDRRVAGDQPQRSQKRDLAPHRGAGRGTGEHVSILARA
jgi:hypothetical protein